jgi:molecular chaperone DnaK (HSP70)
LKLRGRQTNRARSLNSQLSALNFLPKVSRAKFSIGIDLGTTNCAMAFVSLNGETSRSEIFPVPQWETSGTLIESLTLPSFLYLPRENETPQMLGKGLAGRQWIVGRFARKQAAESPGRVAHSAKSWLCHHAMDRSAAFLPWRSDEIPIEKRISPIQASALLLEYLRAAWDARFARQGAEFLNQEITVTVPASFDAVAQRLTLDAAGLAGFSDNVRLLEEPQAAFYRWLEEHAAADALKLPETGASHLLVVDIGGGTSDFSLFAITRKPDSTLPHIKRVAVSDHLLLGGDNIDLALAHHLEQRLASELSITQWNFLVARCRDLKERCLAGLQSGEEFAVSVPSAGSSLLGSTLTARISRSDVEAIVLDGFFPECNLDDRPSSTQAGLREWALPYAADSAVTRYLADFLRGRPWVDAILFNGGSLHPEALRLRLQTQVAKWQSGLAPTILENAEPDLAVARGAARFGSLVHRRVERIEAGAARAIYLEVHRQGIKDDQKSALVCILPRDASAEEEFQSSPPGLELRLNHPVRFQPYYSSRHDSDRPGSLIPWNEEDFHRLPPLQTVAKLQGRPLRSGTDRLPVTLTAKMNELGLLKVACQSADPGIKQSWPLEFNLRQQEPGEEIAGSATSQDTGVEEEKLEAARARMSALFSRPLDKRDKLSATNLLKSLEQLLGTQKANWNWVLIRELWRTLYDQVDHRKKSVEHEEAWLILAGFFLRPGFGADGDEARIDQLWQINTDGLAYPGKRIQLQQYILWRRVAGGLSRERQETVLGPELARLLAQKSPAPELVRLAGALERIPQAVKADLVGHFIASARDLAEKKQHCAPFLVSLGLLLNRAPLYAGIEEVMPAEDVERAYAALCHLDWNEPELLEAQTLFLRAARVIDDSKLDLPRSLREKIASKLEKSGVAPLKVERIRRFVPVERADRASLFGESLPPGLVLGMARET